MNKLFYLSGLLFASSSVFAVENTAVPPSGPTDSQIEQIVLSSNHSEIEASRLAEQKSKNPDVKKFAAMMIKNHTSISEETRALAKKIKVRPQKSSASESLVSDAKVTEKDLKKLNGMSFDQAFATQMVADHQAVLDAIDKTLLPDARNEDLKNLITKIRPTVEMHLQHAKELQAKLDATVST